MAFLRIGLLYWLLVRGIVILSKLRATFSGNELSIGEQSCSYAVGRSRRAVTSVKVGIDMEPDFCFAIRRENTFDQIAKFLHLARAWQTSDAQFDGRIYIVSDDHVLLQSLSADARLRELINGLLAHPNIHTLRCNGGCLWIERDGHGIDSAATDEEIAQSVVADVLPRLNDVRDHLTAVHAAVWSTDRDPGVLRERVLFAVFAACAAAGLVGFVVAQYWSTGMAPRMLLFEGSERLATYWCLPVAGALALVCVILLRGTSRVHLVLLELVLTATPGVWAAARTGWMLNDVRVDPLPAQAVEIHVAHSYFTQGRRSGKHYHLVIADWPDRRIDPDLPVPYALYAPVASGGCLRLQWHFGRLGDPWTSVLAPDRTCGGLAEEERASQLDSPRPH